MIEVALQSARDLEAQRPDLIGWLRPLRVALEALARDPWSKLVVLRADDASPGVPLLHDAIVPLDPDTVCEHVRSVAATAFETNLPINPQRAVTLIEGAVGYDDAAIMSVADHLHVDAAALGAVAQLAALPLLVGCAHNSARRTRDWTHGYCPTCGAWPTLAEVLGLERARELRCGRCGDKWRTEVLLCPFCGERDHTKLGSLVPEGPDGQIWWLDTCATCRGYIKAHALLRSTGAEIVLLDDARSIEIDLIAAERGFTRPPGCGFSVRLRISGVPVAVG